MSRSCSFKYIPGDEDDVLTKSRYYRSWESKARKRIKNFYNKRMRRQEKRTIQEELRNGY